MAKGTWRLADDPNDPIYTGGYVISSHNGRRSNGRPLLTLPPWVVLHIPHDSTFIPASVRNQFTLSDAELDDEILKMTDHHTLDLFGQGVSSSQIVAAPVSRLVVDVERFEDDALEPMSGAGMGVVYTHTHDSKMLRRPISQEERDELLNQWYRPHHRQLTNVVENTLQCHGRCLIIDCHSFPKRALPYEKSQDADRPDICIGTDEYQTPKKLKHWLINDFERSGRRVSVNSPFAGSLVPQRWYHLDKRVESVMVEVRRDTYMNEHTGIKKAGVFKAIQKEIRSAIAGYCENSSQWVGSPDARKSNAY
jgi:N-formylglutamate deformylase